MVAIVFSDFTRNIKVVTSEEYLQPIEKAFKFSLDENSPEEIIEKIGEDFTEIYLRGTSSSLFREIEKYYTNKKIKVIYL